MMRRSLEWFGGSVLVYVLVAACSGTDIGDKLMGDGDGDAMVMGGGDQMGDGDSKPGSNSGGTGAGAGPSGDGDTGGMMGMITDPVPDADAAEDGDRIVNLYRTTSDGLKTAEGYWDKTLDTQCSFKLAEDGKQRCLPALQAYLYAGHFSDSGCVNQVAVSSKGTCFKYAYNVVSSNQCDGGGENTRTIIYAATPTTVVYAGLPGSCNPLSAATLDSQTFYSVTKISASAFAEGTLVHD